MRDDYFWTLMGAGFIVFWAVLIAFARHLRAQQRLREREMIHRERVLALEKGLPAPAEASSVIPPALTGLTLRSLSLAESEDGETLLVLEVGGSSLAVALPPEVVSDVGRSLLMMGAARPAAVS